MSGIIVILTTALIPATSFTSFSIYLSVHPSSPIRRFFEQGRIALPTHDDVASDRTYSDVKEDPFDLQDPVVCDDGTPVEPDKFWASMWKRKVAFLSVLSLPFACNILLLVFTFLSDLRGEERTSAILLPTLLIPSHLITILLGIWYLHQNDTPAHWSTTIHLSIGLFCQFIILAIIALLPSTPLPWTPPSAPAPSSLIDNSTGLELLTLPSSTPSAILTLLLPILHLPPLLVILSIRRGPPLYLPLGAIYPVQLTSAVPPGADALDSRKSNVTHETQATVPEWLLFSYATEVIRKGSMRDSMDVWDLPVLQASMRKSGLTGCTRVLILIHLRCSTEVPENKESLWSREGKAWEDGGIQSALEAG